MNFLTQVLKQLPRRERRAAEQSSQESHVTLQVSSRGAWLITGRDSCQIYQLELTSDRAQLLEQARAKADETLGHAHISSRQNGATLRWRLVLEGGFHHLSTNSLPKWTPKLAAAAAAGLELDCPLALEELVTASLPIGKKSTWTVALPVQVVQAWHTAAHEVGIAVEGIWTLASAMAENLLENPIQGPKAWSDGVTQVTAARTNTGGLASTMDDTDLFFVRVCRLAASGDLPSRVDSLHDVSPFPAAASGADASLPGRWVQNLSRVDPSESLNLARGAFASSDLSMRRQASLAAACWWATAALVMIGIALLMFARAQSNRSAAYAAQMQQVWSQSQGDSSVDATPLDTLSRQAAAWRLLRERGVLKQMGTSQLASLSRWVAALPVDLPVSVSRIRSGSGELWIDGQVHSQADARRLADALGHLPDTSTDSLRTSGGGAGTVNFSLHVVQALH